MKKNGAVALRIAGVLEIIIGIISIMLTMWILKDGTENQVVFGLNVAKEALLTLVAIYLLAGFRIISGFLAIIFSNKPKHSHFCLLLGCLLMIISITSMNKLDHSLDAVIFNYGLLLVPAIYIYGAVKNKMYLEKN